ncbi:hypothetical protein AMS68_004596 [Peltaster fructicola]|uniref:Cytochrome P450 n=1 Tax=Peltaster fructicola TaxID=286661 RepID=A0A6H0XWT4_9PEZI|nr:hypothetical protein AMS68_004596 [Peltaster fructicola]
MINLGLAPSQAFWSLLAGSFVLTYLFARQMSSTWLPDIFTTKPLLSCFLTALLITCTDRFIIWPFFRSPLRKFPTSNNGFNLLALGLESPRGKTATKLIQRFPDADIIHIRSILGFTAVIPVTPEGFHDLMGQAAYSVQKPKGLRESLAPVLGWGLIVSEGDEHKRQRKALTPAFSLANIRGLYALMWSKCEEFSAHVKREADSNGFVEIGAWASKLTLDIIGHAALSQDFKTMSEPDSQLLKSFRYILETDSTRVRLFVLSFVLPQWLLRQLPLEYVKLSIYHCRVLRERCEDMLAQKKKAIQASKHMEETDMLRDVIASGAFKDSEVVDQMMTFLAAGHETTASALSWCCYLLATNPHAQSKLFQELQAKMPAEAEQIDYRTFEQLPYLNGVCEEVLRLFPTVPVTVREVTSEMVMCGVVVPRETTILIVPYAVNRNPKFWGADAAEFKPERWIDTAADGVQRSNKHGGSDNNLCGMTFLHGNRSCIGRDFAKAELKCAVASLFSKYEVSMSKPKEEVKIVGTVTTKSNVGIKVRLQSR